MTVSVLLEGELKDGLVNEFVEICRGAYPVTRAYDGCQGINLTLNVENKNNFSDRHFSHTDHNVCAPFVQLILSK